MAVSNKKLQEKIKWIPHRGQLQILENKDSKEIVICAGRRWGKSALCGFIIVKSFIDALYRIKIGKISSYKIWIVAPTYELTHKVFEYVIKFLLEFDKSFSQYVSGGQGRPFMLKISESIWIQCKSTTEPMSLLGEELDLEIIDEAALIPERVVDQYIFPTTIAKSRNTKIFFISTPRGKNWFYKKFLFLKEKGCAYQFTTLDGVETSEERLEEIRLTRPDLLFRQEYMAEFVEDAGRVFRNIDNILEDCAQDAVPGHHYVMGVDLAEAFDWTAISIFDTDTKKEVHLDRFQKRDYPLQKKQIIAKALRYNNARVIMDTTGVGKPIYEDLMQEGIFVEDFTFSGKTKEELIGKLIVAVEEKYIKIQKNQIATDELEAFEYKYLDEKTGEALKKIKYEAPKGYHDDTVCARALAVWGLNPGQPKEVNNVLKVLKSRIRKPIPSDI